MVYMASILLVLARFNFRGGRGVSVSKWAFHFLKGMVIRTPTFCYPHTPFIPVSTNPIPVDSEPLNNYRTQAHDTGHTVVFNRMFVTQLFIIYLIFNFCSNKIILYAILAWQEMQTESPRCTHCWRVSRMSTTDAIWKSYRSARRRLLMTRECHNHATYWWGGQLIQNVTKTTLIIAWLVGGGAMIGCN